MPIKASICDIHLLLEWFTTESLSNPTIVECSVTARVGFTSVFSCLFFWTASETRYPLCSRLCVLCCMIRAHLESWDLKPTTSLRVYTQNGFYRVQKICSIRGTQSTSVRSLLAMCRGRIAKKMRMRVMPKVSGDSCSGCGLCQEAALWCNRWWCEPVGEVGTGP